MKYLLVNPHPGSGNGISSYIESVIRMLPIGIDYELIENSSGLSKNEFQLYLRNKILNNYGTDEVIIEAPEARAATLLIPSEYKVHIRLHCPLAVAQKYNKSSIDQNAYSDELRVINKANLVSSPSLALVKEIEPEVNRKDVVIYKNPISIDTKVMPFIKKDIDLVFMGRFQTLKGIDYINSILKSLPGNFNVYLIGSGSSIFKVDSNVNCNVIKKEHIDGDSRFKIISRSKVLMLLSRFENCSMMLLESFACCTKVVAWDVGGNSEMAPPNLLRLSPFENIHHIVCSILDIVQRESEYPSEIDFFSAVTQVNNEFKNGVEFVAGGGAKNHKFLNFSNEHKLDYYKSRSSIEDLSNKRIFAFSISNEHIEEMWAPIINKTFGDYRYVCLRPMGQHSCFDKSYHVEEEKYEVYDWIRNVGRLQRDILKFKPDLLLFHNGSHPIYQSALECIKSLGIPIVYSELGWFPQKGNIYFDLRGVNGRSFLSKMSSAELITEPVSALSNEKVKLEGKVLIVTQLDNDTNIIVGSKKYKSALGFVKRVLNEIPRDEQVIIKPHPLDKNPERFKLVMDDRSRLCEGASLNNLLLESKAIVGINSTALIEALNYKVNIYTYGNSILDNKGVAISCVDHSIGDVWNEKLVGDLELREKLVQSLKNIQINIEQAHRSDAYINGNLGMQPIVQAANSSCTINDLIDLKPLINNVNDKRLKGRTYSVPSTRRRKIRKLVNEPDMFFRDSKHKPLRAVGKIFFSNWSLK